MSTLVIVESPGKLDALRGYLGPGYEVAASFGHVRDLPEKSGASDELVAGVGRDFKPRYVGTEKGKGRLAKLRELAAKADRVLLATDPDREGEAIAWHLQDALRLRNALRITFNEISGSAVRAAVASPRAIDMHLVHAQEARRVLDRMVGYAVSPVLSRQAGQPLSAGRVQSPATRLVVEREREIRAFKVREHYGVELQFGGGWKAQWRTKPHLAAGEEFWTDRATADRLAQVRSLVVAEYEDGEAKEGPGAPFTTSTLQQEASKRLGWPPKTVMDVAQSLFDKGLITYHRTDNPNFSEEGQAKIRQVAEAAGLPVVDKPRRWKAKESAQGAHEAIRPVDMATAEAGETEAERLLYGLIRSRALATQLADAVYATRRVVLVASDAEPVNGVKPSFEGKGRVLVSAGWRAAYSGDTKDEGEEAGEEEAALSNPIPVLAVGAAVVAEGGRRLDKKTTPPRRYTQAALVKELEDRGIGRPSTFAAIVEHIKARGYVALDGAKGKFLVPTATGEAIVDALVGKCTFIDFDFTASVEEQLDEVASGRRSYDAVVTAAWTRLASELGSLKVENVAPEHPCPECGSALRRRKGANGFFWGCTAYPECKTTLPDNRGKPGQRPTVSEHRCQEPGCGKPLIHRVKKGKDGFDFWGCSGFPSCRKTYKNGPNGRPVFDK